MPPTTAPRRRAPAMSPADRRAMIVRSVLPLVVQHGAAVTTSRLARAAGIGEGTIFRVFADKDELVDACIAEVLRPDDALAVLAEIPRELPVADRLAEAADALAAHLDRIGALFGALHQSGKPLQRGPRDAAGDPRRAAMRAMRDALTEVLDPEADRLRLPAPEIAGMLLALLLAGRRLGDPPPSTPDMIAVLLHGALAAG